jgi:tetratricopeptide (TPR) repeat protein
VEGQHAVQARHQLACLYEAQGRREEAEVQWRAAVADDPTFLPAWQGLAELYLADCHWPKLEQVADRFANGLHQPAEADVLHARAHLARKELDAARDRLEDLLGRFPRHVPARVYLSHVYLQQAQTAGGAAPPLWDAAEQALRTVVRLDPGQASSWRNLVLLLAQERGRPGEALAACRAGRFHCPADPVLVGLEAELARVPAGPHT